MVTTRRDPPNFPDLPSAAGPVRRAALSSTGVIVSALLSRTGLLIAMVVALALPMAPAAADNPRPIPASSETIIRGGTLVALPPVVQPGTSPAAPLNTGQVVATFEPAAASRS